MENEKKRYVRRVATQEGQDSTLFPEPPPPPKTQYDQPNPDMKYWPAPEVQRVADEMRTLHHQRLCGPDIEFHYFFSDTPLRCKGQDAIATITPICSDKLFLFQYGKHLIERGGREHNYEDKPIRPHPVFVIKVWAFWWKNAQDWERMALCDHELSHGMINENENTGIRTAGTIGHDIEEFQIIVQRWGAWNRGLAKMFREWRDGKMMRSASGVIEYEAEEE